jgi:PTH2 family peptidyl-tRNA hydrolase
METKQVIVVRSDLKLGTGKLSAHVAHASLMGYKNAWARDRDIVEEWERSGQKKVVVKADNERELFEIHEKAKAAKVPCALIKDAGLTQIPPGTTTALAVGPWKEIEVDKLTGHLKLL